MGVVHGLGVNVFYYISPEICSQNDSDEKIVLFLVTANQQRER